MEGGERESRIDGSDAEDLAVVHSAALGGGAGATPVGRKVSWKANSATARGSPPGPLPSFSPTATIKRSGPRPSETSPPTTGSSRNAPMIRAGTKSSVARGPCQAISLRPIPWPAPLTRDSSPRISGRARPERSPWTLNRSQDSQRTAPPDW